jgi:hypothetical protein
MARLFADENFPLPAVEALRRPRAHRAHPDPDFEGQAHRIHDALKSLPHLTGQLVRVNRPTTEQIAEQLFVHWPDDLHFHEWGQMAVRGCAGSLRERSAGDHVRPEGVFRVTSKELIDQVAYSNHCGAGVWCETGGCLTHPIDRQCSLLPVLCTSRRSIRRHHEKYGCDTP